MFTWRARAVLGVALALSCAPAAGDTLTADLILSLHYWHTHRLKTTQLANARLLADAETRRTFRFHLDIDRDQLDFTQGQSSEVEVYEAYGEWEAGPQRLRLGRFQIPFGIYNR